MLAIAHDLGLLGHRHPDGVRAQRALDPPRDDRVLLAVLLRAQQPLAEVVVDRRVGAAPDRPGQRDRAHAQPLAAHQQLGRRADERRRRPARRRRRSSRRRPRAARRRPRRRRGGAGAWTSTSRASTIFSRRPARDQLDGARDRRLVVLRRHRAGDRVPLRRVGVKQRQRPARAATSQPRLQPRSSSSSGVVARRAPRTATVHQTSSPPARERHLRHDERRRGEARPVRAPPPSGAKAKPPQATSPPPAGPATAPGARAPAARASAPATRSKRPVAAVLERHRGAERSDCRALAIGLLEAHPRLPGAPGAEDCGARVDLAGERASSPPRVPRRGEPRPAPLGAAERRDGSRAGLWEREGVSSLRPQRGARRSTSRRDPATSRSRRCASSRSARTGARRARTPRSSRRSPVISIVIERFVVSTTRPRKISANSRISLRAWALCGDLEQRELARDRAGGLEVADLQHVDQLVQLLGHLVDRVQRAVDGQRDARELLVVGRARR